MATIRCIDVADSAQFVAELAELRNRGGRSFVTRAVAEGQATLLGKAAVKKPWTPNAALTTKQSMRFCSSTREWLGVSFFFVPLKKESSATRGKEKMRVWLLCWRVEGRSSTEGRLDSLCSLSLHGSEGRSSKVLVADASSTPVGRNATIWTVSADETDVEVVMSVNGATRALVLFCNAVGVKPSPFVTEGFVGKASVTTALTTVARRLTLCSDRSAAEKRHFESALAFKAPAIVHAWSAMTKQTVNLLMLEVGTKHGYFSDGRRLVHSLWWRRWICSLGT